MTTFIAFLRGINVGGKQILMKDLVNIFEKLGYSTVTTILASGNVIFDAQETSKETIKANIEHAIQQHLKLTVSIQIRSKEEIHTIIKNNPFKKFIPDKNTHWYVTLLDKPHTVLPTISNNSFQLLAIKHQAVFSTLDRQKAKSTDFMTILDKTYGKGITTRNWNTMLKIHSSMGEK